MSLIIAHKGMMTDYLIAIQLTCDSKCK